ncbi:MAG: Uma2 family endonuclease [Acetobacteraceae bacterium]|nr:Uma2 family endonuclease [Acetobacteraceae bacterium]
MSADEFIAWAMEQPDGARYELVGGEVVGMAPERVAHARVKARVFNALAGAIERGGLACEAFPDGMAVQVSADTVYEPDALVRCGPPLPDDDVKILDPVVVVEVLSPSTRAYDAGAKLGGYLRMPSVRHYLLLDIKSRLVIHHERSVGGDIATRIAHEGALRLDPPGIALDVAGLFQGAEGEADADKAAPRG